MPSKSDPKAAFCLRPWGHLSETASLKMLRCLGTPEPRLASPRRHYGAAPRRHPAPPRPAGPPMQSLVALLHRPSTPEPRLAAIPHRSGRPKLRCRASSPSCAAPALRSRASLPSHTGPAPTLPSRAAIPCRCTALPGLAHAAATPPDDEGELRAHVADRHALHAAGRRQIAQWRRVPPVR